ncbi:unnamed protein product [Amoebophrya sp. A25]|nr:unnamed protein product [Amoebophrya sp. A25]|eukprot:GSA25T00014586001.1
MFLHVLLMKGTRLLDVRSIRRLDTKDKRLQGESCRKV